MSQYTISKTGLIKGVLWANFGHLKRESERYCDGR